MSHLPDTHIKQEHDMDAEFGLYLINEEDVIIEGMTVVGEEDPRIYNELNQEDCATENNEHISQVGSDNGFRECRVLLEAIDCGSYQNSVEIVVDKDPRIYNELNQEDCATENNEHISQVNSDNGFRECRVLLEVMDCGSYLNSVEIKNREPKPSVSDGRVTISDKEKTFKCTFCQFEGKHKRSLRQHVNFRHNRKPKCYNCNFCDFGTKYKSSMIRHFRSKHNTNQVEEYECEFCEYRTKLKDNLVTHCDINHEILISPKQSRPREWLSCIFENCEYKTKRKSHIERHVKGKHYHMPESEDWHQCESCEYKTHKKSHLTRHIKLKHDDAAKWYQCQFCEYKSKHVPHLTRHVKLQHDDSAVWYQCSFCDFSNKNKHYLTQHVKIRHAERKEHENTSNQNVSTHSNVEHEETTNYECVFCAYKTTKKVSFLEHYEVKHESEPEWFYCYNCQFKALIKQHLIKHIRSKHSNNK